ncbi:MAG: hypothetical protein ACOC3D_02640 [Pseudomonadota bacterium]
MGFTLPDLQTFFLRTALNRVIARLVPTVPEVPPELEACEYACRAASCTRGHWATCEKRLARQAALEAYAHRTHQPVN